MGKCWDTAVDSNIVNFDWYIQTVLAVLGDGDQVNLEIHMEIRIISNI